MLKPNSKIIVEVKINSRICNTKKDSRLSKEMICYQLSKRLDYKIDRSIMIILIRVFDDMDENLVININNHQDYKIKKNDAVNIKKTIARELSAYIQNPAKESVENAMVEKNRGGALAALLQENGAALAKDKNKIGTRTEVDAVSDYKEKLVQHNAYLKSKEINAAIKDLNPDFGLFLMSGRGNNTPSFYFQITKRNVPYLWVGTDTNIDLVLSLISFIDRFTRESISHYKNGLVTSIYGLIGASEYLEAMPETFEFIRTELDYISWSEPYIKGFLSTHLWFSDDKQNAHIPTDMDGQNWIDQFRVILSIIFKSEKSKINNIIIGRLM